MNNKFIKKNIIKNSDKGTKKLKLLTSVSCYLIPVTCFLSAAYGAQLYPLNDLHAIEAEISHQGLTRITVKDDRILNVFGITGEYVLETDEDQGQIFIRPMGQGALNPISLTLTTERGYTQDLRLAPKDKAAEALILQAAEASEKHSTTQNFPNRDEIEALIQACQEERIPVAYKSMSLDIKPTQGSHRLIREIRNTTLRGLTYELKNRGTIPCIFEESGFAKKLGGQVIAILMPTKILKPGESTHVYVVAEVAE